MKKILASLSLQTLIQIISTLAIIASLVFYVQFQARNILSGPSITLNTDPTALQHEQLITLAGITENIVKITLNGKEIHTDEHGFFKEALLLENGYTIVTLQARDRFGRTTTLTREYVYVAEETPVI